VEGPVEDGEVRHGEDGEEHKEDGKDPKDDGNRKDPRVKPEDDVEGLWMTKRSSPRMTWKGLWMTWRSSTGRREKESEDSALTELGRTFSCPLLEQSYEIVLILETQIVGNLLD